METDERLPLSYIAQYGYCPRRAGLLMNQQLWTENEYTTEGRFQHKNAHEHRIERRGETLSLYEFPVFSDMLGLSGKCDCIEAFASPEGAFLPGETQSYILYPIEYKHGPVRREPEYEQQLCAQALCLEQMYKTTIMRGALFYIQSHRRQEVAFTCELRQSTRKTIEALRQLWLSQSLPPPQPGPRCGKCSMQQACLPRLTGSAFAYRRQLFKELAGQQEPSLPDR
ncbi:MAG: CRISPR-associated protein Cas4 [Provencibacterium sp.]|jgi:CRISPR-associated exonuclease Cas4|nr:CRISPR-associated protein Cas4 [Provencibacterium sp.]